MGNKLGKRRQVVDEKYTRPQGLYPIKDVDYKKLRKLILESKLAPCYPGADECDSGVLEECPICFLYYPTLNRSRCCSKSICTECFLQLKNPNSTHPTNCPFCKTPNYAVEYRGVKSKEERGLEQIEEQKVIEAKIRMRQEEVQEEEERLHRRQETSFSGLVTQTENIECSTSVVVEGEAVVSSHDSNGTPLFRASQNLQQNQYDPDVLDMDLEDIMVMEAIWLSIQENGRPRDPSFEDLAPEQYSPPPAAPQAGPSSSSSSPSGGLASAIAALAERQQVGGEQSGNYSATTSTVLRSNGRGSRRTKKARKNRAPKRSSSEFDMQRMNATSSPWDWFDFYHGSQAAEAGTSYVSSAESDNGGELLPPPPPPPPGPLSPESVYISGMSGASSNGSDVDDQLFAYLLPPPPPPFLPPYVEDGWSVFAS